MFFLHMETSISQDETTYVNVLTTQAIGWSGIISSTLLSFYRIILRDFAFRMILTDLV